MEIDGQECLNLQNSVTERMPIALERLAALRDRTVSRVDHEGLAGVRPQHPSHLLLHGQSEGSLPVIETMGIYTRSGELQPFQVVYQAAKQTTEGGAFYTKAQYLFGFTIEDGVTHLQTESILPARGDVAVRRFDDPDDLKVLMGLIDDPMKVENHITTLRRFQMQALNIRRRSRYGNFIGGAIEKLRAL